MLNQKVFEKINKILMDNNVKLSIPKDVCGTLFQEKSDIIDDVVLSNLVIKDYQNYDLELTKDRNDVCYSGKINTFDKEFRVNLNEQSITNLKMVENYYSNHLVERLFICVIRDMQEAKFKEMSDKTKVWKVGANFYFVHYEYGSQRFYTINTYRTENATNLTNFPYNATKEVFYKTKSNYEKDLERAQPVYLNQVDIPNNLEACDDKDRNKVWVVRRGVNYGMFEVDESELYVFHRCFRSGYLLSGLSNYFNERTSNNGFYNTAWIDETALRCEYSFAIIDNVSDVVRTASGRMFSKSSAERLKNLGFDDLDLYDKKYRIKNYHDNPDTLTFSKFSTEATPLYLGVELEVDSGSGNYDDGDDDEYGDDDLDYNGNERDIHSILALSSIAKGKDVIFSKTDGSLNSGFEMVSHPTTLAKHTKELNWKKGMDLLTKLGYGSHNTSTCGLHVHINKDFFGGPSLAKINGAKIAYLLERNKTDVVNFTRRKDYLLDRWARFGSLAHSLNSGLSEKTKAMLTRRFTQYYPTRQKYVALNTAHSNTFEFRIFRGTLNYATFLATLQFVDNLARLVKEIPNTDDMFATLDQITFDDIVNYRPYAELTAYWTKRKGAQ